MFARTGAPKPIEESWRLSEIVFSKSMKAPPQMKRISFVSICMLSPLGCLRAPFSGTLTIVPSNIFSNACWTPSPETSLLILRLSAFLVILSTSSMYTMPC
uniref:Uncharacterized protein n=1 Tax=Opuntia streptacantha TaxID=393608 RepID=A0A7C9AIZ4_OPUST